VLDKAENNNEMIDAGFVRMLAILSNKKWGDDDIIDDLKTLSEALAKNMVVLRYSRVLIYSVIYYLHFYSSFDMYKKEIMSGQLTWSPVHKSEKFWRESATRFEENDYQLLRYARRML
jgi:V-type H+-transporting ATPase subunit H